jgi:hypothetical protein
MSKQLFSTYLACKIAAIWVVPDLQPIEFMHPTLNASPLLWTQLTLSSSRAVRDKLDRVAIQLHLAQWQALTLEDRRELYEMPCTGSDSPLLGSIWIGGMHVPSFRIVGGRQMILSRPNNDRYAG